MLALFMYRYHNQNVSFLLVLGTAVSMNHSPASKKAKLDELGEFDRLFPELVECLNDGCLKEKQLQKVLEWFKEV